MLHWLVHCLREYGFDATLIPERHPFLTGKKVRLWKRLSQSLGKQDRHFLTNRAWNTPCLSVNGNSNLEEIQKEWIIVYPESVFGNPLKCNRVIRYLLNSEYADGGPGMGAAPSDFLVTYSRMFHSTAPILYYPFFDADLLLRSGRVRLDGRVLDAYYVGKGKLYGPCPPVPEALELKRDWPATKAAYYDLLENIRILYSYDWLTSTTMDATLLGCEVRLIGRPGPIGVEQLLNNDSELKGLWHRSPSSCSFELFAPAGIADRALRQIQGHKAQFASQILDVFSAEIRHLHC